MDKQHWLLIVNAFLILAVLLVNVQWHYDRMCGLVFSEGAYFKMDGVYCHVNLSGVEFKLAELLARHERVQRQIECMAFNPDQKMFCDPRWLSPAGEDVNG